VKESNGREDLRNKGEGEARKVESDKGKGKKGGACTGVKKIGWGGR